MSVAADPWSALADPTRRTVFARVAAGPCSVTEIARDLPVSRPAVSQHLRVLLDAHLVDVRKQGRERLYRPRPDGLADLTAHVGGQHINLSYESGSINPLGVGALGSVIGRLDAAILDTTDPDRITTLHALKTAVWEQVRARQVQMVMGLVQLVASLD